MMDIKMGCRTYLEEELTKAREKPTLRKVLFETLNLNEVIALDIFVLIASGNLHFGAQ